VLQFLSYNHEQPFLAGSMQITLQPLFERSLEECKVSILYDSANRPPLGGIIGSIFCGHLHISAMNDAKDMMMCQRRRSRLFKGRPTTNCTRLCRVDHHSLTKGARLDRVPITTRGIIPQTSFKGYPMVIVCDYTALLQVQAHPTSNTKIV
jgi:hypothetical protein